ncbi:MAG: META domain-containing protein [Phycisphaerales bacterium]
MQTSIKTVLIFASVFISLMITPGCESADRDVEPIRVDAVPHANAVKQAKQDWTWISGTTWIATSIEGQPLLEGTAAWLRFQDHTWMSGSSGCNQLSASYDRQGIDGLQMTQIASTRKHCAEPRGAMQQESRFLHLLQNIDAYQAEPDALSLSTNGIQMLTFARLDSEK